MPFITAPGRLPLLAFCVLLGCDGSPTQTGPSELPTAVTLKDQDTKAHKTQRIAFSSNRDGNFEIYSMNFDGTDVARLTNLDSRDGDPDWSPDGRKLAFTCNFDICVMNADGSNTLDVTNSALQENWPAWSPDGRKIAFAGSVFRSGELNIYVMNADGTDPVRITSGGFDLSPAWSPKGNEIAFVRVVSSGGSDPGVADIYTVNPDGSQLRNITNSTSTSENCCPSWSPSHRIAVAGEVPNQQFQNSEIYVMKDDGSQRVNLTNHPAYDFEPSWSPNGSKIAFTSGRVLEPYNYDVFVMSAKGRDVRNLTANSLADDYQPDWSP